MIKESIQARQDRLRREVIAGIRACRASGRIPSQSPVSREWRTLVARAVRLFASWDAALRAAGEDPVRVKREQKQRMCARSTRWTREAVLAELRACAEAGIPLTYDGLNDAHRGGILGALKRLGFEVLADAVGAAGIPRDRRRRWKGRPDVIIASIQALHVSGVDLCQSSANRADSGLLRAAASEFGSWDAALTAAGVIASEWRRDRHQQSYRGDVFEGLCYDLFALIRPVWEPSPVIEVGTVDGPRRMYPDARDPADTRWIDFKTTAWGQSAKESMLKYRPHAPHLEFIFLEGEPRTEEGCTFTSVFEFEVEARSHSAEAGALIDVMRRLLADTMPIRPGSYDQWAYKWSPSRIIEIILALPREHLPSSRAQRKAAGLFVAAGIRFGSWSNVLQAAGIDPEGAALRPRSVKEVDVASFIDVRRDRPNELSFSALQESVEGRWIYGGARRIYGADGWREALRANGVDPTLVDPRLAEITEDDIEAFIRRRQSKGLSLAPGKLRDDPKGLSFYAVANRIHGRGGWQLMLRRCGLNPREVYVRPILREEDMVAFVLARKEAGLSVSPGRMKDSARGIAYVQYCRRRVPGGWDAIIRKAGYDPSAERVRPRRARPAST